MSTKGLRDQLDQIAMLEKERDGSAYREDKFRLRLVNYWLSGGRELAEDGMRIHWVCENDKMKIDEWRKTIDAARAKEGKK